MVCVAPAPKIPLLFRTIRPPPRCVTTFSHTAHSLSSMAYPTSAPRGDDPVPRIGASSGPARNDAPETRLVQDMRAMHLRMPSARPVAFDHEADGWLKTPRGHEAGEQAEVSQSRVPSVNSLPEHGPRDMIQSPAPGNDVKAHNRLRPALRASPKFGRRAEASDAGVTPCEDRQRRRSHSNVQWDSAIAPWRGQGPPRGGVWRHGDAHAGRAPGQAALQPAQALKCCAIAGRGASSPPCFDGGRPDVGSEPPSFDAPRRSAAGGGGFSGAEGVSVEYI